MTSRDRIIDTFNFKKTDRPARYEIFFPDFISNWRDKFGMPQSANIYDHYSKIDIGGVLADQEGPFTKLRKIEKSDGETYYERDSWGRLLLKKNNAFFEKEIESIFAYKNTIDQIPFESPFIAGRYDEVKLSAQNLSKHLAPVAGVLGLYMGCYRLRGQEQFLMDLAEDKEFCRYLIDRLEGFTKEVAIETAYTADAMDTALWVYDEFSSRIGPMFSPRTFEELFLPAYKRMIEYWKSNGLKNIILHCDGNSLPILDMIIEAGFTGIQSLAPTAGMWLPDVKERYGNKLVLIGGMCNIETLFSGSFPEIKYQVEAVADAAKSGGVIIGTHSIDSDIPVDNYDYYYFCLNKIDETW